MRRCGMPLLVSGYEELATAIRLISTAVGMLAVFVAGDGRKRFLF